MLLYAVQQSKEIVIGSDHAGFEMKSALVKSLTSWGCQVHDIGVVDQSSADYPDIAQALSKQLAGSSALGILICGSGIGMSIAANRHQGVRAALCHEPFGAQMARRHNDANCLCLGSRWIGFGIAEETVKAFLTHEFEGGRHQRRVDKIDHP